MLCGSISAIFPVSFQPVVLERQSTHLVSYLCSKSSEFVLQVPMSQFFQWLVHRIPRETEAGRSRNPFSLRCMDQVMRPSMLTAPSRTKGGKKGGKGKDVWSKPKKFDGHCCWCGAHGHTRDDCRKKVSGKPRTAWSPTVSRPERQRQKQRRQKESFVLR